MNDLRPLIRLHRWQLDERQRALAALRAQEEHLLGEAAALEAEIKAEQQAVAACFEISFGYAGYAQAALARRERLAHQIAVVRAELATATEALAEAFQEVKRYELAQEERERQDKERLRHKENEILDETAMIGFQRRRLDEEGSEE